MTAPANRPAFTPVWGLRIILAIIAIILYIIFLVTPSHNVNLLAYAGIATAVGLIVP